MNATTIFPNARSLGGCAIAAILVMTSFAPAEAQHRRRNGDRAAAGIFLGLLGIGAAAIAAQQRRDYYEGYGGYGYYGGYRGNGGYRAYRRPPNYGYGGGSGFREQNGYGRSQVYRQRGGQQFYIDPYSGRATRLLQ